MLNRLILKVTKFQLPPPKRLGTVVKNISWPPMSSRVNQTSQSHSPAARSFIQKLGNDYDVIFMFKM